jgi:branched-chain amino acid transport system substrate-binding protein
MGCQPPSGIPPLFGRIFAIALAVLASLALSGRAKAEQIVVVVGPMTGSESAHGIDYAAGVKRAISEINAKGGLLGQKLTFSIVDDACDADQAEAAAQQIVEERPAVVIGHYCSSCSIRAAPVYAKARIVQISPTSTNPRLTEIGLTSVFRMVGRDDDQGRTAVSRLAAAWPHGKIAVLDDGGTYGKGLADVVRDGLKARGIKPVLSESFQPGAQTYSAIVRRMRTASVQAVFIGAYDLDIAVIAREVAAAGLHLTILAGDALVAPSFWDAAGKAGENLIFTFSPNPLDLPAGRALIEAARRDGVEFSGQTVLAYASVEVWAEAVRKAGSFDTVAVAATLHASRFASTIGPVQFDRNGDVLGTPGEWLWYRWRAGKIEHAAASVP